jgi:hypothetical protein
LLFQVLNPVNATCGTGQGGLCVSQLTGLISDNQNVLNRQPDVNLVLAFGFHFFAKSQAFNRGSYERFFGMSFM